MPRRSFAAGIHPDALAKAGHEAKPPLESQIQAGIVRALKQLGWTVWTMYTGSERGGSVWSLPGIPDLYVFKAGKGALWLEIKRPKLGRVSDAQQERHAELTAAGIPVYVVRSLDDVLEVLPK